MMRCHKFLPLLLTSSFIGQYHAPKSVCCIASVKAFRPSMELSTPYTACTGAHSYRDRNSQNSI